MSSSAINAQLFQAKIGSIQNQADSSGVYSAGVWSFKNSTALTSVTITDSGNVGIGTASPSTVLDLRRGAGIGVAVTLSANGNAPASGNFELSQAGDNSCYVWNRSNNIIAFGTNNVERMRLDASGNLLVGTTDASPTSGVGMKLLYGSANMVSVVANYNANIAHFYLYNLNATNNGARFSVNTNGGISNYSANNTNLSDERVKTDISLASSYLEKICSIPVKTFRYKDQGDDMDLTLGVIAQDVERVAPELVNITDGFGDIPEDGVPLKTVYQTDLQYALMKCIQELKEKNDALEARLAALEAKP